MPGEVNLNFTKPYPFPIRAWNFLGEVAENSGFRKKLTLDKLLRKAKETTGLQNFGEEFFMEPLEKLIDSINREANLHAFGFFITKTRIVNLLANRLRAENYTTQHPEILEQEILPIWWIVGLQRTGTTFLQRLLAAMPGIASLSSWEALNPVPFENDTGNKKRISIAKKSERGLKYIAPEFFAIHPVEHRSPEEEILLLDISFLSTVPEATLHVPSYASWLEKQDQTPAYEYMRKLLKIIQFKKKEKKRWVLKSPHHLEFLNTMTKVFPQTNLIVTHRDPVKTIASFCSMIYFSRRIFSSNVEKVEIANHWLRKLKIMLTQSMKFRELNSTTNIKDIPYSDLISEPVHLVEKIFESFGAEFSKIHNDICQKSLNENKKNKFGLHKYSSEDFGLNTAQLEIEFSAYKTRFSQHIK